MTTWCVSVRVQGHHGKRYGVEWVERLHRAMSRNMTAPVRHACITDTPGDLPFWIRAIDVSDWWNVYREYVGGLYIPIGGWWAKVQLFNPVHFPFGDTLIYSDLDNLITGPLDGFLTEGDALRILPDTAENKAFKPGVYRCHNSSVMSWKAGTFPHLFNAFTLSTLQNFRSDQDWIAHATIEQNVRQYRTDTFKRLSQCLDAKPAAPCSVVICIKPKNDVAAKTIPWVREHWQ